MRFSWISVNLATFAQKMRYVPNPLTMFCVLQGVSLVGACTLYNQSVPEIQTGEFKKTILLLSFLAPILTSTTMFSDTLCSNNALFEGEISKNKMKMHVVNENLPISASDFFARFVDDEAQFSIEK